MKLLTVVFFFIVLSPFGLIAEEGSADEATEPEIGKVIDEVGIFRQLDDGGFINLRIEERKFVVYFLDEEKQVTEIPGGSIIVKITQGKAKHENWYGLLNPRDDISYTSPRGIYPPYQFELSMIVRYPGEKVDSFHKVLFTQSVNE